MCEGETYLKLSFTQWLFGVCRFSAEGDFPERFLNLASRADLGLWNIRRSDGSVSACVIAARYKKLRPYARKCGLRLRVRWKEGLPFLLMPYRKRVGMVLGFAFFCVLLWFLSLFVWFIDMPEVSPEVAPKLEQAVYDCGLRTGVRRSQVSGEMIGQELMLAVDELSWAGVSVNGSHVVVDVRELERLAEKVDIAKPCNVVASEGGVVMSVVAEEGDAAVARGQTVAAGDLLLSGVVELADGSVRLVHARGEVTARVGYQLCAEVPFEQQTPERTGRVVTIRRVMLLGMELPLSASRKPEGLFERECSEWQLRAGKTAFPLSVRTEKWFEQKQSTRILTAEEAAEQAGEELDGMIEKLGAIEILSVSRNTEIDETCARVSANITAVVSIGRETPIFSEEKTDP